MTLSPPYPDPASAAATPGGAAANAPGAPSVARGSVGLLGRVTIRTRLILLSSALLIILVATNLYLSAKLSTNSAGMVQTAELLKTIEQANSAQLAFGEVRYLDDRSGGQPVDASGGQCEGGARPHGTASR
jgi:hypothetical protein